MPTLPPATTIHEDVQRALEEDIGSGDITTELIPHQRQAEARLICRQDAVLCGTAWFEETFRQLSGAVTIDWHYQDGDAVPAGAVLCRIEGPARSLLSGERTALNFLQTLSGTATLARRYADAVAGLPVKVLDTRKTLPGLRRAQKYAVACGGCHNHRMGLYDAVLIKENHIETSGSITAAVAAARKHALDLPVEVEVDTLAQLEEALACDVGMILLDNFDAEQLREAVAMADGRTLLEASGGISLENIRMIAETGVDRISVGDLTKSVRAVDLSLEFRSVPGS